MLARGQSPTGSDWVLLNAAPDLRQQINDTPELGADANGKLRNSPIKAVVVTGGDVDFITGLLNLRELQPFTVYGSSRVLATLAANSVFNVLNEARRRRAASCPSTSRRRSRAPAARPGSSSRPSPFPARSRSTSRTRPTRRASAAARATPSASR